MAAVKPIRNENDYNAALSRVDELMSAEPGSLEGEELDALADLVETFEAKNESIGYPDPVQAIEFRMEQAGLGPCDLIPFISSRARVSQVLASRRPVTVPMARALHEHLGIPAGVLLRQVEAAHSTSSI